MDGVDDVSLHLHHAPLAQLTRVDLIVHLRSQHARLKVLSIGHLQAVALLTGTL